MIPFLILIVKIAVGQESPYKNYKMNGGQLLFSHVYDCDSLSSPQIESLLNRSIPTIKGVTDFRKEENVITCRFINALIDYRKYGKKWASTPALLNHPYSGNITIEWKDKKYKVVLSNVIFHTAGFGDMNLEDILTRNKGKEWDERKNTKLIGNLTEQYFIDLFVINYDNNW